VELQGLGEIAVPALHDAVHEIGCELIDADLAEGRLARRRIGGALHDLAGKPLLHVHPMRPIIS
jgi:hypothetical protein